MSRPPEKGYAALLRAVNVGGTGKLAMTDLAAICVDLGFTGPRTYIQSGNVIFFSKLSEQHVQRKLESKLTEKMGKKVDVAIRTAAELEALLAGNPFPDASPAKVAAVFLAATPDAKAIAGIGGVASEEIRPGDRVLYIHYPDGMGKSKLRLPTALGPATARNLNTVAKLAAMLAAETS